MKTNIIFILFIFSFLFQACETNDELTPQTKTPTLQKRTQDNTSFNVSVTGRGEIFVEIGETTTTVEEGENITFEAPEGTVIRLYINENSEDAFGGWFLYDSKVSSDLIYETVVSAQMEIRAAFGKKLTVDIKGPGSIIINNILIDKSLCPYTLFFEEDNPYIDIKEVFSEDWSIHSITDQDGNIYQNYIDMSDLKEIKLKVIFSEFTRYLTISELPEGVDYKDYYFTINGYHYLDAEYSEVYPFNITSIGENSYQSFDGYIQSRGLELEFNNTSQRTLKVKINFDGDDKEYNIAPHSSPTIIKLKSANYQEDRLITLEIRISKY